MLELLRGAAQVARRSGSEAVPPGLLSFTLEYERQPEPEVERARIEKLLGGGGFDLFPYSREDDPELLILQFPGLEAEQSPDYLMEVAQDLCDALDIASVTPEIRPPYRDVLAVPPLTEGLGDVIWALCTSKAASPKAADWARKLMRVDRAEARFGVDGRGILVAQPDTGVADHVEIQSGIDRAKGWDFVADRPGPVDPLSPKMGSPGHGTGTSSLVASRRSHVVTGSATGATLVPIRAVELGDHRPGRVGGKGGRPRPQDRLPRDHDEPRRAHGRSGAGAGAGAGGGGGHDRARRGRELRGAGDLSRLGPQRDRGRRRRRA